MNIKIITMAESKAYVWELVEACNDTEQLTNLKFVTTCDHVMLSFMYIFFIICRISCRWTERLQLGRKVQDLQKEGPLHEIH